jgi:hypothetical protein
MTTEAKPQPKLNGEQYLQAVIDRALWHGKREEFRPYREATHMLMRANTGRVLALRARRLTARNPKASLVDVLLYRSREEAEDAIKAIAQHAEKMGVASFAHELEPVSAYEYCKAREYLCCDWLAGAAPAGYEPPKAPSEQGAQ